MGLAMSGDERDLGASGLTVRGEGEDGDRRRRESPRLDRGRNDQQGGLMNGDRGNEPSRR